MGGNDAGENDADGNDADGGGREPGPVDPEEIGPAGAMIAVAFTGSVIAFVGFGLLVLLGDVGLVLAGVGLLVVLASPAAYLRYRQLYR
ncbi:hypothetical protein SAMN04488066_102257 [Halorubrum aquaticum]|uniref:Uncharacterized protein n=1 Tax=Halorubrum aquaticum TaxID=387340 RepID=A0A1I2ZLM4_9EURY|nr:hypothetical protein [Halorubrum aquaticum]SFH38747.1 hypothetical protein SAMN04488066_102257 [Halorubrum aquaticum]